ncbi:MAG: hypothetical protein CVU57_13135 [Deltaproteobacteria bacterium HGW-Deltaproteobacteria-15]|jgi:type IV fimbrial biogenesis protein FimT|nr:MAG: hypothetical protein CVU57_13135 [Deltaproteobacteria bacterium HGW-Deltaproteobacteria-15]
MRKLRRLFCNNFGFTLTEAIVSCFVIAITGSIGVSVYSSWYPKYQLKAAARDLYSSLQHAKMMAIKNKIDCKITYSVDPDRYVLSGVTKTVTLRDYGDGIRFEGPQGQTFSVPTITFNSRGFCNAGYAYLTNNQKTTFFRIGPSWSTGAIRLQQYGPDGWE